MVESELIRKIVSLSLKSRILRINLLLAALKAFHNVTLNKKRITTKKIHLTGFFKHSFSRRKRNEIERKSSYWSRILKKTFEINSIEVKKSPHDYQHNININPTCP